VGEDLLDLKLLRAQPKLAIAVGFLGMDMYTGSLPSSE
jgi:hypothetical protein